MLITLEEKDNYIESIYDSSNIVASKYIRESEILYIIFKNNKVYSYTPVNEELFNQFQLNESQGKFFISHIKNNPEISTIKEDSLLTEDYNILVDKSKEVL